MMNVSCTSTSTQSTFITYRDSPCSKGDRKTQVPSSWALPCVLKVPIPPLQRIRRCIHFLPQIRSQILWPTGFQCLWLTQRGSSCTLLSYCYRVPSQVNVDGCHQGWKICLLAWPNISKCIQVIPFFWWKIKRPHGTNKPERALNQAQVSTNNTTISQASVLPCFPTSPTRSYHKLSANKITNMELILFSINKGMDSCNHI